MISTTPLSSSSNRANTSDGVYPAATLSLTRLLSCDNRRVSAASWDCLVEPSRSLSLPISNDFRDLDLLRLTSSPSPRSPVKKRPKSSISKRCASSLSKRSIRRIISDSDISILQDFKALANCLKVISPESLLSASDRASITSASATCARLILRRSFHMISSWWGSHTNTTKWLYRIVRPPSKLIKRNKSLSWSPDNLIPKSFTPIDNSSKLKPASNFFRAKCLKGRFSSPGVR